MNGREAGPVATPTSPERAVELIRRLFREGFGQAEAGNIAGLAFGLRPIRGGWSAREIEHLRFVRQLARSASRRPRVGGRPAGIGFVA